MKPGDRATLRLDDYTPYLLNRAGSRIADSFTAETRRKGLTLSMWRVLAVLDDRGPVRLGDLAEATSIEVSTLSRLVQQMAGRGLLVRERDAGDQRAVTIRQSEAGRAAAAELIPLALDYERRALDGFEPGEVAQLKALLRRLYGNMAAM